MRTWRDGIRHVIWNLFRVIVRPRSGARTSLPIKFPEAVTVTVPDAAEGEALPNSTIEALRSLALDFVLCLADSVDCREIPSVARFGVWAFGSGYDLALPEDAVGFWEIVRGLPAVSVVLRRFDASGTGSGSILREGLFPVRSHSFCETVNMARSGSIDFPLLACKSMSEHQQCPPCNKHSGRQLIGEPLPDNRSTLILVAKLLRSKLFTTLAALFTRFQWNVGLVARKDVNPLERDEATAVKWLPSRRKKGIGVADPFIIRSRGQLVLMAEEVDSKEGHGYITASRMFGTRLIPLGTAIKEEQTHLSYPFLCESAGEIYCIPEQCESGTVVLYRATDFPRRWEPAGRLLSGVKALDPTLFRFNSYWWLAYTEERPDLFTQNWLPDSITDPVSRLMLWYSRDLRGPWSPHSLNPVKIDARSSRSAGTPFYYHGILVRPAQDCSRSYGAKIVFNRVITLTPTEFHEETVGELAPDVTSPYRHGLHTICFDGEIAVVDGCRRRLAPLALWTKVRLGIRNARRRETRDRRPTETSQVALA